MGLRAAGRMMMRASCLWKRGSLSERMSGLFRTGWGEYSESFEVYLGRKLYHYLASLLQPVLLLLLLLLLGCGTSGSEGQSLGAPAVMVMYCGWRLWTGQVGFRRYMRQQNILVMDSCCRWQRCEDYYVGAGWKFRLFLFS